MSLKPTEKNRIFGSLLSAESWARQAIGSEKMSGQHGFDGFCSGEWMHFIHYKLLRNNDPSMSPRGALPEMAEYRARLCENIMSAAREIDGMVKQLQKMEEQMADVQEFTKE